jgi:hypothetical protein
MLRQDSVLCETALPGPSHRRTCVTRRSRERASGSGLLVDSAGVQEIGTLPDRILFPTTALNSRIVSML